LIASDDGVQQLYNLSNDIRESNNLLLVNASEYESVVNELTTYAKTIRTGHNTDYKAGNNKATISKLSPVTTGSGTDLTDAILTSANTDCASYSETYRSKATDVNNNRMFTGELTISVDKNECVFQSNAIPNHNFNDGKSNFRNPVKTQHGEYRITTSPVIAAQSTPLTLNQDDAILLNGVKVDLLAAGCFNVGNEKTGCNDPSQPWRFDPMHSATDFKIDSHNAHTQPNGAYHYHGQPNALYDSTNSYTVVGFAADGFPIFGGTIPEGGSNRKVKSGYRLKNGQRPTDTGSPGGSYDGTFRDDYEYVAYILACFSGKPHDSFNKRRR